MLVTLAATKENCFQTIQANRISKFIWQRVPDCQCSYN